MDTPRFDDNDHHPTSTTDTSRTISTHPSTAGTVDEMGARRLSSSATLPRRVREESAPDTGMIDKPAVRICLCILVHLPSIDNDHSRNVMESIQLQPREFADIIRHYFGSVREIIDCCIFYPKIQAESEARIDTPLTESKSTDPHESSNGSEHYAHHLVKALSSSPEPFCKPDCCNAIPIQRGEPYDRIINAAMILASTRIKTVDYIWLYESCDTPEAWLSMVRPRRLQSPPFPDWTQSVIHQLWRHKEQSTKVRTDEKTRSKTEKKGQWFALMYRSFRRMGYWRPCIVTRDTTPFLTGEYYVSVHADVINVESPVWIRSFRDNWIEMDSAFASHVLRSLQKETTRDTSTPTTIDADHTKHDESNNRDATESRTDRVRTTTNRYERLHRLKQRFHIARLLEHLRKPDYADSVYKEILRELRENPDKSEQDTLLYGATLYRYSICGGIDSSRLSDMVSVGKRLQCALDAIDLYQWWRDRDDRSAWSRKTIEPHLAAARWAMVTCDWKLAETYTSSGMKLLRSYYQHNPHVRKSPSSIVHCGLAWVRTTWDYMDGYAYLLDLPLLHIQVCQLLGRTKDVLDTVEFATQLTDIGSDMWYTMFRPEAHSTLQSMQRAMSLTRTFTLVEKKNRSDTEAVATDDREDDVHTENRHLQPPSPPPSSRSETKQIAKDRRIGKGIGNASAARKGKPDKKIKSEDIDGEESPLTMTKTITLHKACLHRVQNMNGTQRRAVVMLMVLMYTLLLIVFIRRLMPVSSPLVPYSDPV